MALLPGRCSVFLVFPPSACQRAPSPWLGPHRAGQFGKILPCKLDHIPHPQDGAEGGLVRVEAARLHVCGCQVGKEVSPAEKRREARPSTAVMGHAQRSLAFPSPGRGIWDLMSWTLMGFVSSVPASSLQLLSPPLRIRVECCVSYPPAPRLGGPGGRSHT